MEKEKKERGERKGVIRGEESRGKGEVPGCGGIWEI
jgi:hypothetical protein